MFSAQELTCAPKRMAVTCTGPMGVSDRGCQRRQPAPQVELLQVAHVAEGERHAAQLVVGAQQPLQLGQACQGGLSPGALNFCMPGSTPLQSNYLWKAATLASQAA